MKTVVIETRGGAIQEIYTDDREARVVVVNWDELEHVGDAVAGLRQTQSLSLLPPDTREQIEAAGLFGPHIA
jgi:hypothetical protein